MKALYPFQTSPRCTATSKRTKCRCQAPAVRGYRVCRFHGARGGAPKGKRNGAYRNGLHTVEAKAQRARVRAIVRGARDQRAIMDGDL